MVVITYLTINYGSSWSLQFYLDNQFSNLLSEETDDSLRLTQLPCGRANTDRCDRHTMRARGAGTQSLWTWTTHSQGQVEHALRA